MKQQLRKPPPPLSTLCSLPLTLPLGFEVLHHMGWQNFNSLHALNCATVHLSKAEEASVALSLLCPLLPICPWRQCPCHWSPYTGMSAIAPLLASSKTPLPLMSIVIAIVIAIAIAIGVHWCPWVRHRTKDWCPLVSLHWKVCHRILSCVIQDIIAIAIVIGQPGFWCLRFSILH